MHHVRFARLQLQQLRLKNTEPLCSATDAKLNTSKAFTNAPIAGFPSFMQIDRLVYDLYGLTENEIAGVKGKERSKLS